MDRSRAFHTADIVLCAAVFVSLVGVFLFTPPLNIWTNDEAVKYIQMKNFYLHNTLALEYPGKVLGFGPDQLKPGQLLIFEKAGKLYAIFPPLFTWLSSFLYPVAGEKALNVLPLVTFFLSFIMLARTVRLLNKHNHSYLVNLALLLTFLVASPALIYALSLFEHIPALFCVVSGLYFTVRYFMRSSSPLHLFLSALLLSSGIFFRTEIYLLAAAFGLALGWTLLKRGKKRDMFFAMAGFAIPVIANGVLNFFLYGSFLGLHVDENIRLAQSPALQLLMSVSVSGAFLLSFILCGSKRINTGSAWKVRSILFLLYIAFIGIFFRFSPIFFLMLEFPAVFLLFFSTPDRDTDTQAHLKGLLLGTCMLFIIFCLIVFQNRHDSVRFALPLIPFVLIFTALNSKELIKSKIMIPVVISLILFSLGKTILHMKNDLVPNANFNRERVEWLLNNTQDGDIIIFENEILMHHEAPAFFSRIFLIEDEPHKLRNLFNLLGDKGISRCFFFTVRNGYVKELKSFSQAVTWDTLAAGVAAECCVSDFYLFKIPLLKGRTVTPPKQPEQN